jgi:NAD(P)-dependent dehydrogenase (short-subunit alcohol dehydrogenase family)
MSTVLITGSNRGIGLELARRCSEQGHDVIAVCRQSSVELDNLGVRVISGVDVGNEESIALLVKSLEGQHIDWRVNNAGILERTSLDHLDFESMERQFRVNSLGPLRVSAALLPNLGEGSKVFIITSRMGSIADNTSGSSYGYRMSKTAVNMAGKSLAVDLKDRGIAVFLLHPGWVATEMTERTGIDVRESAAGLFERMNSLGIDETGTFWHQEGYPLPW